jgi:hypothetical protein
MLAEGIASLGRALGGTSSTSTSGSALTRDENGNVVNGSYESSSVTYDDAENQALTQANISAIQNSADERKARELTGALLATTLFSSQEIGRIVHFEREKKAELSLLSFPIRDRLVQIPLVVRRE